MYNYIENKQTKSLNDTLTVNGENVYLADIEETWQKYANLGLVRADDCQIRILSKSEQLEIRVCPGKNINIDNLKHLQVLQNIVAHEMKKELKNIPLSVSLADPIGLHSAQPDAKKVVNLSNSANDTLTVNGKNVYLAGIKGTWQKLANKGLVRTEECQICVLPKSEQLEIRVCPGKNVNIDSVNDLLALQDIVTYDMKEKLNIPLSVSLSEHGNLHSAEPNVKKVVNLQSPVAAKLIGENCRGDR